MDLRKILDDYASFSDFPSEGVSGVVYLDRSNGDLYVWDALQSVYVVSGNTSGGDPAKTDGKLFYVYYATTSALPANTYNNGAGTLTGNSNGALTSQDGQSPAVDDIILVKNEANAIKNGIYKVTTVGSVSVKYVLTRIDEYNQTSEVYPSQVYVINGNVNGNKSFFQETEDPVIGTDGLVYESMPTPTNITQTLPVVFVDTYTGTALPACTYTDGPQASVPAFMARLRADANGTFPTYNGVAPRVGLRVLVTDEADPTNNGDYTLVTTGGASSKWNLYRITHTAPGFYPMLWSVYEGNGKGKFFHQETTDLSTPVLGTTGNIVFSELVDTARIKTITSSANISVNSDQYDTVQVTALATNTTIDKPTGTPKNMQQILYSIKGTGTNYTLTFSSSDFTAFGSSFPSAVNSTKEMLFMAIYSSISDKWRITPILEEQ